MKLTITKRTVLTWIALISAGICFYFFVWPEFRKMVFPQTPPPKSISTPAQKPSATNKPAEGGQARKTSVNAGARPVGMAPAHFTAGNVGEITKLRADLEKLRVQAQISEAEAKMAKNNAVPAPVVTKLPDLPLPPVARPLPVAKPSITPSRPPSSGVAVVSVQGIDGDISATVRSGSGFVTVRKGSRFGNGVVTDISHRAVTVNRNGKVDTLPFE